MSHFCEDIEKVLNKLVVLTFFVTFVIVMIQIISRFIPSMIVPWTEELTRMSFMYTICFGAPLGIRHLEFAKVDGINERLPLKLKYLSYAVIEFLILIFCAVVSYRGLEMAYKGQNQLSVYMRLPMYIFYVTVPVCFFLCAIMTIEKLVVYFRQYKEA